MVIVSDIRQIGHTNLVAHKMSMAADHALMEDFIYPNVPQSSVDHAELPSIPEASVTAPDNLPTHAETSNETEVGRERASLEPTPIQEAPRPNYTNHTELSATFAEALGSPASLVRDYSNQTSKNNGKRSNSNDFVTTGLENLSRLAGLPASKPSRREEDWHLEDYGHVPTLPETVYEVIHSNFQMLNTDSGLCRRFTDKELPPLTTMNAFIQSYFEHYNHVFPLIHQPTFDTAGMHWVLILAVAATGCGFSQMGNTCTAFILQEFLRRSVNLSVSPNGLGNPPSISQTAVY
ncbi:hypothetical protein CcaCcLH18_11618 [Colletotrichum camelliae]|nr:hypothetical protein CcaCcLH18_11618 [Colletotrichum camelliae]